MARKEDVFRNPCKYCLTKPVCNRRCKEFNRYHNTMTDCSFMIISLSFFAINIASTWFISTFIPDVVINLIVCGTIQSLIYAVAIVYGYYDDSIGFETENMKVFAMIFGALMFPYVLCAMYVQHKIEQTTIIETFIYRYNKKINPFNPDEEPL